MRLNTKLANWRRIELSTNGVDITIAQDELDPKDLMDLYYAALEKIPHSLIAMELALEKYKSNHELR